MDRYYIYALLDPRKLRKFKFNHEPFYKKIENAMKDGFYSSNVSRSIKNGKAYKGLFWKKYKNN